jgi:cell division protein FtsN
MEFAMNDAETARFTNMIDNKSWRVVREARVYKLGMLDGFEPGKDLKDVFKQPEKPEPTDEVAAEDQDSAPKPEEQTEDKEEAMIEDKDSSERPTSGQQSQEEPVATTNAESVDQAKTPAAIEKTSAVADSEKMQADDSIAE